MTKVALLIRLGPQLLTKRATLGLICKRPTFNISDNNQSKNLGVITASKRFIRLLSRTNKTLTKVRPYMAYSILICRIHRTITSQVKLTRQMRRVKVSV